MRKNLFTLFLVAAFLMPSAGFAQTAAKSAPAKRSAAAGFAPTPVKITPAERKEVEGVTADQLKNYLYFVASDEMEGRDTPSRGLDTTAKFIAMNLTRWRFKPAGDNGTFFQRIALRRDQLDGARSTAEINGQKYKFGDDFLPNVVAATFTGPLVYVGNGWVVKSKNIDAYQGVDL